MPATTSNAAALFRAWVRTLFGPRAVLFLCLLAFLSFVSASAPPALAGDDDAPSVAAAIPGLVGYWKLDGSWADASGHGHTGTPINAPTFVTDHAPTTFPNTKAGSFSHGKAMTAGLSLTSVDNITMSAWVKYYGPNGDNQYIIHNGTLYGAPTYGNGYGLILSQGNPDVLGIWIPNWGVMNSGVSLTVGQWMHIAAVRRGSAWELYLDGQLLPIGPNTVAPQQPVGYTLIGDNNPQGSSFNGLVDDVRFYDRALNATEVASLALRNKRFAKPGGKTSGTCNSWANACTLEFALGTSPDLSEIWVMKGTHKPSHTNNQSDTFNVGSLRQLYGGFIGTETLLTQRNWKTNVTILSGDIGVPGENYDNSCHVVTTSGANNTALLDGFTIKYGNASSDSQNPCPIAYGGGILNLYGDPMISNVVIANNEAGTGGGGMYNEFGRPYLLNVTFANNVGDEFGGGLANRVLSNAFLQNVTFVGNSLGGTTGRGGAIFNNNSNPILMNVTLTGNSARTGGAIANYAASPLLRNVTMYANGTNRIVTTTSGGAMYDDAGSYPDVRNSIIWGNSAQDNSQIYDVGSAATVDRSVVQGGFAGVNSEYNPVLQPLAYNGGATQTMALGAQSAAINLGDPVTCAEQDQRGLPRRVTGGAGLGACDAGAYEAQVATIKVASGSGQSTRTRFAFPAYLTVVAADKYQNKLQGVPIDYSGPGTGAGVVLNKPVKGSELPSDGVRTYTNFMGLAYFDAWANDTTGSYAVKARTKSLPTILSFALKNTNTVENEYRQVLYDGWAGDRAPWASGGTYRFAWGSGGGRTATFKFTGTKFTLRSYGGPDQGIAGVSIDGVPYPTVDLYFEYMYPQYDRVFLLPTSAAHTVVLTQTGTKNPSSTGDTVRLDAMIGGTTVRQDDSIAIQYGQWKGYSSLSASGGTYRASASPGSDATLYFKWTGVSTGSISWVTATGPAMGMATVVVDGASTPVDLYTPTAHWQVVKTYPLGAGLSHWIQIFVSPSKNPLSKGNMVVVDGFRGANINGQ